jgi:acyl-CoA thioesterase FadM
MSAISSTWPVLLSFPVAPADLDDRGCLTHAAVERMFDAARAEYFERCHTLDGDAIEIAQVQVITGSPVDTTAPVTISTGAVELYGERFVMAARLRSLGQGVAADARCNVVVGAGITDEIRDELIALAHSARHYH